MLSSPLLSSRRICLRQHDRRDVRDQARADHLTHSGVPVTFVRFRCPPVRGEHGVLDVAVEVEGPDAALAADAGLAVAAERCAEVADEEAVDPDGAGVQREADPFGTLRDRR